MTLLFDRPFWRSKVSDSFFMLDEFGGCCLYDESARDPEVEHGVLGWLLGGQTALEMSAMEDDALITAALDSLPDQLAEGREYFLEGRVHRWVNRWGHRRVRHWWGERPSGGAAAAAAPATASAAPAAPTRRSP